MKQYNVRVWLIDAPSESWNFLDDGIGAAHWLTQKAYSLRDGQGIRSNIGSRYTEVHIREVIAGSDGEMPE